MMLPKAIRVLVARDAVDFRKSYDGLCGVCRNELSEDPQSATLFVFRNKRGDQVRLLWWDRNGFAIWMKRLESGTFLFPRTPEKSRVITATELAVLLEGAVRVRCVA